MDLKDNNLAGEQVIFLISPLPTNRRVIQASEALGSRLKLTAVPVYRMA
jgi:hypothetical protein